MWFANDGLESRNKIRPEPEIQGFCPVCDGITIPHCGSVMPHYWAHKTLVDCDHWSEGETTWHLDWKERIAKQDKNRIEVKIGTHRADVVARDGTVVELQHSAIDLPTLMARQEFYKKLVWVLDCKYYTVKDPTAGNFSDDIPHIEFSPGRNLSYVTFYWRYPKKTFNYYSTARFQKSFIPVLLDLGGKYDDGDGWLFLIRNVRTIDHWTGWGMLMTYSDFIKRVNQASNLMLSLKTYNPLVAQKQKQLQAPSSPINCDICGLPPYQCLGLHSK